MEKDKIAPEHYRRSGRKECIEEMVEIYGKEDVAVWCEITAYKYLYRAGLKEGESREDDLRKREWYLKKAEELREENENDQNNLCMR